MTLHPLFTNCLPQWQDLLVRAASRQYPRDAEDLAQDVITQFWKRWQKNPSPRFQRFLDDCIEDADAGRLHKRCWQALRRVSHRRSYSREVQDNLSLNSLSGRTDPTAEFETEDLLQCILRGASPNEQLLAAGLRNGLSMSEIAQDLRRPERTVYSWHEKFVRRAIGCGILQRTKDN